MDYLLGRNPLAFSYVAGYGTHALRNPHHRSGPT
jgi:endoglucanase